MFRIMHECGICGHVSLTAECRFHGRSAHYPLRVSVDPPRYTVRKVGGGK